MPVFYIIYIYLISNSSAVLIKQPRFVFIYSINKNGISPLNR